MAQTIKLKRSATAGAIPSTSDLALGEIAINTADGAVYIKKGNDDIVAVHDNDILHIDTTNSRVGIGTTSPSNQLHIQSSGGASAIRLEREDTSDEMLVLLGNSYGYVQNTTGPLGLGGTNSSTDIYINASGNVGIGTTSPGQRFHVSGGVSRFQGTTSNWLEIDSTAGSGNDVEISTRFNTLRFDVPSANSAAYDFKVGGSSKLFMDDSGNVGIGDTTPSSKLHVVGDISNSSVADYGLAAFENTDLEGLNIGYDADGNHSYLYSREVGVSSRGLRLNGAIYIDSYDGNVGVGTGTNSLTNKLQVDGFAAIYDGLRLGSAGSGEGIFRHNPGTGNQGIGITTGSLNSSGIKLFVQHPTDGGGVGIGTDSPQNPLEINTTNKLGTTFTGGTDGEGIRVTQTNYVSGNHISLIESSYDDSSSTPDARIGVLYNSSGSTLKFGTSNNYTFGITNTAMVINPTGRVGIGTDAPDTTLHVDGVVKIGDTLTLKEDGTNDEIKSTANVLYVKADEYSFQDNSNNQRIAIGSSGAIEFNNAYTFPTSDGTSNQVLTTNGSGQLSFADVSGTSGISVTNNANNRVLTGDGTNANAEANLTFDGSTLDVTGAITSTGTITSGGQFTSASGDVTFRRAGSSTARILIESGNTTSGQNFTVNGDLTSSGRIKTTNGLFQADEDSQKFRQYHIETLDAGGSFLLGKIENSGSTDGGVEGVVRFAYDFGSTTNNCAIHFNFAQRSGTARGTWWYEHDDQDGAADRVHVRLIDDGAGNMYVWVTCVDYAETFIEANWRHGASIADSGTLSSGTLTTGTTLFDTADDPTSEMHIGKLFAHDNVYIPDSNYLLIGDGEDLQLQHNGSHSYIRSNTGDLYIRNNANDKDIFLQSDDGSGGVENYIQIDGSEGRTLFNKPIRVNDSVEIQVGNSNDLRIEHNGTTSTIRNYTGNWYFTQYADDQSIVFECDDGSGGIESYLTIDGANNRNRFHKNVLYGDGIRADFGNSSDLKIYHDGSNSYIDESGTGNLILKGGGSILLKSPANENMITATGNGAVTLYYDNSAKLATTSTGIDVTGITTTDGLTTSANITLDDARIKHNNTTFSTFDWDGPYQGDSGKLAWTVSGTSGAEMELSSDGSDYTNAVLTVGGQTVLTQTAGINLTGNLGFNDNVKALFGTNHDLQIYHNGSASYIDDAGTGSLYVRGNNLYLQKYTGETYISAIADGSVTLYDNNSAKLATKSDGVDITGELQADSLDIDGNADISGFLTINSSTDGKLKLKTPSGESTDWNYIEFFGADGVRDGYVGTDADGDMKFASDKNSSELRLESTGATIAANLTVTGDLTVQGTTTTLETATLDVEDKNITLNYSTGDSSGSADGAGITIQDAVDASTDATILWDATNDEFDFSHAINSAGTITGSRFIQNGSVGNAFYAASFTRSSSTLTTPDIWGSNGTLVLGTSSSTEAVAFSSADSFFYGNVGIGTTSPSYKLDVVDNGNASKGILIQNTTTATSARSNLRLISDAAQLDIYSTSSTYNGVSSWTDAGVLSTASNTSGGLVLNAQSGGIKFQDATTEIMRISDGGNVGVNESTPLAKMEVAGSIKATSRDTGHTSEAGVTLSYDTSNSIALLETWTSKPLLTRTYNYQAFDISGTEMMRINSTGVGIGITSPTEKLHVAGNIKLQATSSTITFVNNVTNWSTGLDAADSSYKIKHNSAERMRIDSSGNLLVGTTSSTNTGRVRIQANANAGGDSTALTLHQSNFTNGAATLIKIGTEAGNFAKGSIGFKRTASYDRGAIIFCQENTADQTDVTSSNEVMRIASDGKVGIGTSSPASKLSAVGTVRSEGFSTISSGAGTEVRYDSSAGWGGILAYDRSNSAYKELRVEGSIIKFKESGTDVMTIDGNKVGIGTTSPSQLLSVAPNTDVSAEIGEAHVGYIGHSGYAGFSHADRNAANDYALLQSSAGKTFLNSTSGQPIAFRISNADQMNLNATGLGIGTTSPTEKLEINGGATSNFYAFRSIYTGSPTHSVYISAPRSGNLGIFTDSTEQVTIDSSGNVGIGTTSPSYLLDVNPGSSAAYTRLKGTHASLMLDRSSTSYDANLMFMTGGTTKWRLWNDGSDDTLQIYDQVNSANVMTWEAGGQVGIGTSSPQYQLDIQGSSASARVHKTANDATIVISSSTAGAWTTYKSPNYYAGALYVINGTEQWAAGILQGVDRWTVRKGRSGGEYFTITNPGKVGINQSAPAARFQVEEYGIDTTETSSTATTQIAIHTFAATDFRSARFTVQVTNSTDSTYHTTELLMVHDGTTANITEFGEIFTGSAVEATFDADISSGNVRLLATPASTDSMEFKVVAHTLTT